MQHLSAGTYQVTITAPACAQGSNAPVITVSDSQSPGGQGPARSRLRGIQSTGSNQQFMVFTGEVVGGSFTPTDHAFTVMDTCM